MTPSSQFSDDELASLIPEYSNSWDAHQRWDFLEGHGMSREDWRATVSAYHGRMAAAARGRASTDASQAEASSASERGGGELLVPTFRIEFEVDVAAEGGGRSRYESAPPSRGAAATGPGRRRSGGARRRLVRIVITLSEKK